MASRVVVVVPRQETGLHDYLQKSLACLKDVEVVLDRRTIDAAPSDDRRRQPATNTAQELLICSLVHCPAAPPPALPDEPPVTPVNGTHRTLLWPRLRLENL
jgi:hypothetical protein